MFSKLKRLGSTACRVQISIDLHDLNITRKRELINLVCLEFERKNKSLSSSSKVWSEDKSPFLMHFDESLTLLITLYKDSSGNFLEKSGLLILKGYSEKTASSVKLGSVSLKLSSLAADYAPQKIDVKFVDDKGRPVGLLNLTVTAKYLGDATGGDDESSVSSYSSDIRSLAAAGSERVLHGSVYKESSPSKLYSEALSKEETDRYRRSLAQPASRSASFTFGCERDDDVDSVVSGESEFYKATPRGKTRRGSAESSMNDFNFNTQQYEEMVEIMNKNKLLQTEIDDLTGQLYRAGKKLTISNERIGSLQEKEVVAATEIQALKDAVKQSDARYTEKDERLAKLTIEKRDLKYELIKAEGNENSLNTVIAGLRKDVHIAQCESAAVQAAVLTIEIQKVQAAMGKMREQAAVALTERSGLLSELENTKNLLIEAEEAMKLIRNDTKMADLEIEKQALFDDLALSMKKIKKLEEEAEDHEVEKKMSSKKEAEASRAAYESSHRHEKVMAKMQSKNEKMLAELNKWKSRYDDVSSKNNLFVESSRKKDQVTKETIEHLQQEVEESLNQLSIANDFSIEQQDEIDKQAERIKELESRLQELRSALDDAKERQTKADSVNSARVTDLRSELDALKIASGTDIITLKDKVEELTTLNADLVQRSQGLQAEVDLLSSQSSDKIKHEKSEREKLKAELLTTKVSLAEVEGTAELLQDKLSCSQKSEKMSEAAITAQRLELIRCKEQVHESHEALNNLEADIEKTMTEWCEKEIRLEDQVKSFVTKVAVLEEKEVVSSRLVADLGVEVQSKSQQIEVTETVVKGLKGELADQVAKTEKKDKIIESLRGDQTVEMEKMMKEIQAGRTELFDQVAVTEKKEKTIESLRGELAGQVTETEKRSKEIKVLKGELADQALETEKKGKEGEALKIELADQEAETVKRDKIIDTLRGEVADQAVEVKKRDKVIEALRGDQTVEIEKMVKAVQCLKDELADQAEELEKRDKVLKASKDELADQITETEKRVKVIKTLRSEIEDQKTEMEKKEREVEAMRGELADQTAEMEKRGKETKGLKGRLADQVAETDKKVKENEVLCSELVDQVSETEKRDRIIESLRGDQTVEMEKMLKAVQVLKDDLIEQAMEREKKEKESKGLRSELAVQVAETEKRDKIIEALRGDQTAEMEKMVKEVGALKSDLSDEVVKVKKRDQIIEALRGDHTAETEKLVKAVEGVKEELTQQVVQTANQKEEVVRMADKVEAQTSEIEKVKTETTLLKSNLAAQVALTETRVKDIEALSTDLKEQKIETEKRDKIIEALRGDQTAEMEKMVKEIKVLKGDVAEKKVEMEKRAEEVHLLRSDLAHQVDETKIQSKNVESITIQLADQVRETVDRDEIIKSLRGGQSVDLEKLSRELVALRAEQAAEAEESDRTIESLRVEVVQHVVEADRREEDVALLREEAADHATEIENMEMVADALKEELHDQAAKMEGIMGGVDELKREIALHKAESDKMQAVTDRLREEIALLSKQLDDKTNMLSALSDNRMVVSDKETSFKNQLKLIMFEKKSIELELEKAQEHGYAMDLVSKQNISTVTAEKDRIETAMKKLKSQLATAAEKTNENTTSFAAERQKLKADLVKIQRDADLVEVTAKSQVEEMTAERDKMHAEWLDKTSQFDSLATAAMDAKKESEVLSLKIDSLLHDLQEVTRRAEDLSAELDNAVHLAADRELALSSNLTVATARIECIEKMQEASALDIVTLTARSAALEAALAAEKQSHGALQLLHVKMCSDRCMLEDQIDGLNNRGEKLEADLRNSKANTEDLSVDLDNAEHEAMEREFALSSSVTKSTSKIDCLEKILEESQIQRMQSDSKCLAEYTALALKIDALEGEVQEGRDIIASLETHVSILQGEKQAAHLQLDDHRVKAADREKAANGQMKILLFERKSLEAELSKCKEQGVDAEQGVKHQVAAVAAEKEGLESLLKAARSQVSVANENAAAALAECKRLIGETHLLRQSRDADILKTREEEEAKVEGIVDEVSESFLEEIKSLNEELVAANEQLVTLQEELEQSQLNNSTLEEHLKDTEAFSEQQRQRHENQVIQLLKIVGIYDESSHDPLDNYWIELFRIQMDEERIKIMTLKNCLMRFSSSLTTVDNGLLRGAGIILVADK